MFGLKQVTNCMGYQQITSLNAAATLTVPSVVPNGDGTAATPLIAMIQCTGQNVRWRDDGTAPTSSVGMVLYIGDTLFYDGDLKRIKFIETASSAKLDVSYYK